MSSPTVIVNSTPVVKVSYGLPGIGVPSGGIKPQVLKKSSSADYATEWGDVEVLMLDRTDLTFTGTLSKGDPVYINSSGQIAACDAADAATLPPVGLVAGDVTDPEDDVDVILVGALIDANTATFSVGDRLYVATGGGITATAPSGTDASYSVGVVSKVDSTEGIISVYVDGSNNTFEGLAQNQIWVGNANGVATQYTHQLSTLIDVDSSMSPSANDFLRYSGTQWEASSAPFTFADITGLDHLPQGHVYVGDSSNLTSTTDTIYVDVANSRVGIETTSPQEALHVDGRINLSAGGVNQKYILIGTELPNSLFNGAVGIGERVFQNSTSSSFAVAIGKEAAQNATGNKNIAIGQRAMRGGSGSTGSYNISVGAQTMLSLTDGSYNTAMGQSAMQSLTSGEFNVSLGAYAGFLSTTASYSTYVGAQSGYQTSGGNNVAVGFNALNGTFNQSTFENTVAVGYEALKVLTTGASNTAIGYEALHDLTTGSYNTVLGYQAGNDLTTQNENTLIGYQTSGAVSATAVGVLASAAGVGSIALGAVASANAISTVAIGTSSRSESVGSVAIGRLSRAHERGVFVGYDTGRYNNGEGNTVIGYEAGTGSTQQPGSTYNYNVLLGYRAGHQLETGSGNVFIGYGAGSSTLYDNHRLRISGQSLGVPNATDLIYGEFDNEFVKINGDLEVRDDIVSSNNEDITIIPDGTGHVLLGNYEFDTNQTLAPALDRYILTYDANTEEISLQENPALEGELDVNLVVETVKNDTANTLNKGTVVYITGEDVDGNTTVDVANNTDETKMPAVFVLNEDIAAGATGQAVFSGLLDAVNTAGFSVGDVVYVGNNGNFVSERPESPNVIQEIAIVANVSATDGKVYVSKDVKEDPEKIHFPVRNDEGATIPAGTPIYSKGEIGGSERILVGIADASDPTKMPAIGIATTELTTTGADQDGLAIMVGTYNTNISGFTGLANNDVLYVASGGGLTKDKPTGSNLIQNVGIVLKTNGTICQGLKVSCIGRTNDVPNIATGNIWAGNANGAAQATDTAYIDIANGRVGIGTTSPTQALHVSGSGNNIYIDDGNLVLNAANAGKVNFGVAGEMGASNTGNTVTLQKSGNTNKFVFGTQNGALTIRDDATSAYTVVEKEAIKINSSGDLKFLQHSGTTNNDGKVLNWSNSISSVASVRGVVSVAGDLRVNDYSSGSAVEVARLGNDGVLRFWEGANYVGLKAASAMTSDVEFVLPATDGTPGQVLTTDGSGNLTFATSVSADTNIANTDLTLDNDRVLQLDNYDFSIKDGGLTRLGWNDAAGAWSMVGSLGITGDLALTGNFSQVGNTTHTGSFEVRSSSSITAGAISIADNDNSNTVTIAAPSTLSNDLTFVLPSTDGQSGHVLQTDGSGNLSFAAGGTGTGDNLATADLTQTSGQSRTYTTASSNLLTFETSTTTPAFIRIEDYGDATDTLSFQANPGRIKFKATNNAVSGAISLKEATNNGNDYITIQAPSSLSSPVTLTLPNSDGDANQVLKTDGSGNLDWVDQTTIPALNITRVAGTGGLGEVPFYSSNNLVLDSDATFRFSGGTLSTPKLNSDQIPQVRPTSTSAVGTYGGNSETISKIGTDVSVVAGKVYNLAGGSFTETDAEAEADSKGLLAVASATGTTNGTDMVLKGAVKLSTNAAFSGASIGDPVYLRGADGSQFNKGTLTATPPSTPGDIVRIVGYVTDPANGIVYFNPDSTFIEV